MNRVTETLGDLYGMHWPYKQHKTSREQKLLPYHEDLKKVGACFGQSGEYERPMWYALDGAKAEYVSGGHMAVVITDYPASGHPGSIPGRTRGARI